MSHENTTAVIAMPGDESLAATLAARLGARLSVLEFRRFPDGESYLRLDDSLDGRSAVLVARLDRPDAKIPALLFAANVDRPVVIGPDAESAQWVEAVAVQRNLPWQVMRKQRFGDHDVRVTAPDLSGLGGHTPVLVDDIVSSGATLARAAELLTDAGLASPRCAVVHGLFGARSRETLAAAGIERLVCTDSVLVDEGEIELAPLLAAAVANMLE